MKWSTKIAGIFFTIIIAVSLLYFGKNLFSKKDEFPILGEPGHRVGNFSFTNQDGKIITQKDIEGKLVIAEYFFTTCPGICKDMSANLKKVYSAYEGAPDVIILSHTVDPETDSVPILKAYAEKYNVKTNNWQFLTGDKYQLYKFAQQDYLLTADSVRHENISEQFIHTQYVCLLDKQRRIRGFYDATDAESTTRLIRDIGRLRKK